MSVHITGLSCSSMHVQRLRRERVRVNVRARARAHPCKRVCARARRIKYVNVWWV